jgi:hypothetical protein
MKRKSFLKKLVGGVAGLVMAPSVISAISTEERVAIKAPMGNNPGTGAWIDKDNDVIEWKSFGGDFQPEVHVNGVKTEMTLSGQYYKPKTNRS